MFKFSLCTSFLYFYFYISVGNLFVISSDVLGVYEVEPINQNSHVSFEYFINEDHYIEKRDLVHGYHHMEKRESTENKTELKIHEKIKNSATKLNETKKSVPEIFPSDAPKLNSTLIKLPIFPTNASLSDGHTRLLGVNGTGQRKQFSSATTIKPTLTLPTNKSQPSNNSGNPNFDDIISNVFISKFTDKDFNKTLAQHNITNETITESYFYYNSTLITDQRIADFFWVNLSENENATTHKLLSSAHRRAATVTLSFEFPFYGHLIKNVTIATGGFLYTGDYVHAWLAATQYIAPLMANFDTSLSNDSFVRYLDNGTAFTVVWENVALKDTQDKGEFTFQTTLHRNGDIVFVFKSVPLLIEDIKDDQHPVKIGLSDAYIIDSTLFFLRRKTIYEYHRVNFQKGEIRNGTVIFLKALPTCLDATDCTTCLTRELSSFQCVWCPALRRCSSGVDRHRQEWIMKGCDQSRIKNESHCSSATTYDKDESNSAYVHDFIFKNSTGSTSSFNKQSEVVDAQPNNIGISGVLAIIILMSMLVAISMWVMYAYKNPHTTSGQMLIRYRPTQWRWKRGEARYTAATIHM